MLRKHFKDHALSMPLATALASPCKGFRKYISSSLQNTFLSSTAVLYSYLRHKNLGFDVSIEYWQQSLDIIREKGTKKNSWE